MMTRRVLQLLGALGGNCCWLPRPLVFVVSYDVMRVSIERVVYNEHRCTLLTAVLDIVLGNPRNRKGYNYRPSTGKMVPGMYT